MMNIKNKAATQPLSYGDFIFVLPNLSILLKGVNLWKWQGLQLKESFLPDKPLPDFNQTA